MNPGEPTTLMSVFVLIWVNTKCKTRLMKMLKKECQLKFWLFCKNSKKWNTLLWSLNKKKSSISLFLYLQLRSIPATTLQSSSTLFSCSHSEPQDSTSFIFVCRAPSWVLETTTWKQQQKWLGVEGSPNLTLLCSKEKTCTPVFPSMDSESTSPEMLWLGDYKV